MHFPILSSLIFLPLVGVLFILMTPKENEQIIKWGGTLFSGATLLLSLLLWKNFNATNGGMQFNEWLSWIPSIHVMYHLGIDGLSLPLVFLTTLLTFLCMIYSWTIKERPKEYFLLFLLLETGMLGTFLALDLFLFYVFWEISLVPMYFQIGIWGGPRKEYASIKFFLYTLVGSVAMLLSILALYFNVSPHTFDMLELAKLHPFASNLFHASFVFFGFFLAFAIKVPLFPFHTWLPDAHVEAPTAGSVILAGVLLKMGTYGFIRVLLPILPEASAHFAPLIAFLAIISIVYGALVAMAQWDLKKLVAYSSVNHMGYVMLATASAMAASGASAASRVTALNGAVLQMFNHGVITGALFFLVGVIYDRTHTRDLKEFGGLAVKLPVYAGIFSVACFGSLGLPGLAGFVSEFLTLIGSFPVFTLYTSLSVIGIIVTAAFFLWTIQRMLLGPLNPKWAALSDMDRREIVSLVPLVGLMLLIGIYPASLLNVINTSMSHLIGRL